MRQNCKNFSKFQAKLPPSYPQKIKNHIMCLVCVLWCPDHLVYFL